MGCFVVPMAEALIVSIAKKAVEKKQKKAALESANGKEEKNSLKIEPWEFEQTRLGWSQKLSWLSRLLWGGVFLLVIEHIWHGEVVLWPPFLTAMRNPSEIPIMLHEMATVGTSMAIFVTLTWAVMVTVAENKMKHALRKAYKKS